MRTMYFGDSGPWYECSGDDCQRYCAILEVEEKDERAPKCPWCGSALSGVEDYSAMVRLYLPNGAAAIAIERVRQVEKEGWTAEHDDGHTDGELARAAGALLPESKIADPWGLVSKHHGNRIRQLEIAGALVAAEIDRLLRRQDREG